MSKKEKMTIIGKGLENLEVLKKQKEQEEKLYARRSINIKGHTLKLRSKIGGFIITDIQANKNGIIVEVTLQNSENKEFKIKLKNSEENDNEIKTSWEQKSGNIIQIIFPKEKNNEEEIEPQRTVELVNDTKTQIQKAPDNVKIEENIIINEEKKEEAINESLEKKEEQAVFNFQIAPDGPIKEFKNGEEFELKEIVSKNGEPEKTEQIKYKVEGMRTDLRTGAKFIQYINAENINKKGKVKKHQDYLELNNKDMLDCLKNNWIKLKDDKFIKEFEEWNKKTKNKIKPLKLTKIVKPKKTGELKNTLTPEEILDTMEGVYNKEQYEEDLNELKKEELERGENEDKERIQEIREQIKELIKEMPKDNWKQNKIIFEYLFKKDSQVIKEYAQQNLEKISKVEELLEQLETISK